MRACATFLAWWALASTVAGQRPIFTVDQSGGPGSQFTDLAAAVAAVPDGSCLIVRPGKYGLFAMTGKGLAIVGEDASKVVLSSSYPGTSITIANTSATQNVVLEDVTLDWFVDVTVTNALGGVVLDGVVSMGVSAILVTGCAHVQLHRCTFPAAWSILPINRPIIDAQNSAVEISYSSIEASWPGQAAPGSAAVRLLRSRCVAVFSTLTGATGGPGCASFPGCNYPPGPGGPGVEASGSIFVGLETWVRGGYGNATRVSPCWSWSSCWQAPYSSGGNGIELTQGSVACFEGTTPTSGMSGGPGVPPGKAYTATPGSTIRINPSSTPSGAELVGEPARNTVTSFNLQAKAGSLGVLLVSYSDDVTPVDPLAPGSILTTPGLVLGPIVVPSSGTAQLPYVPPTSWPIGEVYFAQFVTVEPSLARVWVTNSFPFLVEK